MSIKFIVLAKRKAGLSSEEFRDGYENGHSRLALKCFGHLWTEYRRNYLVSGSNFDDPIDGGPRVVSTADAVGYDVVSEFVVRDNAALEEMQRISVEHYQELKEDEARWFDRPHSWLMSCETIEDKLK